MHRYLKKAVCYLAILICVPYFVTAFYKKFSQQIEAPAIK